MLLQAARKWQLPWLGVYLVASYGAAALGSWFTLPAIKSWYGTIRKPRWTPPNQVFGPVWTLLYTQMALAAWLTRLNARGNANAKTAQVAWCVQLALNVLWSAAFFGRRNPRAGLFVILPLWLAIAATAGQAFRVSRAGGALLLPYLAWTSFATALNWKIYRLNKA